ncbi:glycosyltransferase family 4 protein [Chloroflexia bacterium SDU3-3]|nr:glycosyltransferase family 4 protein [Chloroflexia bacterium SDU3-3]
MRGMNTETSIRVAMLARVVFPLHGFGGIERHVFHLVTHLRRIDVDVTLYAQPPSSASEESHREASQRLGQIAMEQVRYDYTSPWLRPNSIIGRQINYPWYSWQIGRHAAAAARQGRYDVVHAQGLCALGYGWIRQRDPLLRQVPFIANPHGLEEYRTQDWRKYLAYAPFRALYTYGNQCADRVIATDECTKDDVPHYLHVDPAKVVVIPSAIDVEECLGYVSSAARAELRQRLGLDAHDLTLLSVGRLERNKGFHVMIEALAQLRAELPPRWLWLVVGQGKERQALEAQAQQQGLAEHVRFVGRLDDTELHSLYEEIDLIVHPTLYEGSSLVTLEGMIHRKPVVASAAGGIPDKVFSGKNGYLVQPGDAADLAEKLRLTLAQRADWPAWGEESVRIVRSTFDWPVVARRTKAAYQQMLGRA